MIETHRRLLSLTTMFLVVGCVHSARAQDDEPEEDAAPVVQNFVYTDEHFNAWVFGNMGNAGASRNRLESLLDLQMDDLERTCRLTPAQKKKLELAGRGDVKRFFDSVDEKRREFQLVKNDPNQFGNFYQGLQPLQTALNSGLFHEGSLYQKTMKSTLNESQIERYEKAQRERRLFRYRTKVESVVSTLDQSIGFRVDQRRRFVNLFLEETEPPKKYGQYDYYVVLFIASKLPETKLKAIFDDAQWKVMSRHITQAKGMEPFLRSNGFAPDVIFTPRSTVKAAHPDEKKSK